MTYQLKPIYLKELRDSKELREQLEKVAGITEQTRINVIRGNMPTLVKVDVLLWLKEKLQLLYPNEVLTIEDLIEPKKEVQQYEQTRIGAEL